MPVDNTRPNRLRNHCVRNPLDINCLPCVVRLIFLVLLTQGGRKKDSPKTNTYPYHLKKINYKKGASPKIKLDKHSYKKRNQDKSFSITGRGYLELSSSVENVNYDDFYYSLKKIRHLICNYHSLREHIIRIYNLELQVMLIDIIMALENIELSNQDRLVLKDYMNGMSLSDIGKKYHFTRSNADFIIKKITKRVQNYLLGGDED